MKPTNLIALWKLNKNNNTIFIGTEDIVSTLPFMSEYLKNFKRYDRDLIATRGFFWPVWNREIEDSDTDVLNQFKEDVDNLLIRNKDNYQRISDALTVEYNPIENYDRTEETTDTSENTGKNTFNYGESMEHFDYGKSSSQDVMGAQTLTEDNGATNQTATHGAQTQSVAHGAQENTMARGAHTDSTSVGAYTDETTIGAQTNTTTRTIAGMGGNAPDGSETTTNGSRTDSVSHGAHTDSTSVGSYTDTEKMKEYTDTTQVNEFIDTIANDAIKNVTTNAEHTNTHSEDARSDLHSTEAKQDTSESNGKGKNVRQSHIHGNVGVTTNMQMIIAEVEMRLKYNLYKIIYDDIIKELCNYYDEGLDAFSIGLNVCDTQETTGGDSLNNVSLKVEQLEHGCRVIATDKDGTTVAIVNDGAPGADGKTPVFRVESDGDMYVDYDKEV